MNNLENIKQQLLRVASLDYTSSRNLAMKFLKKDQPVPELLLYRIAEQSASAAKEFALWHAAEHMPIPELLIKKIAEDKGRNIDFARNLVDQFKLPVPDITLETIINARDLFDIWTIYEEMLKNDVIPPNWFAQNALDQNYIYPGAGMISQPPEPTNELAYYMAQSYLMYHPDARSDKNLPDYFLKSILANQGTSFSFLKWLNRKNFPVPEKLQKAMKNNKLFRKQIQKKSEESEEKQNKPDLKKQMLQIVASNPRESLRMAIKLLGQNKPIPVILLQGLDRDPEAAFELFKAYMNKFNQAPKSLEDSIVDQQLDTYQSKPNVVPVGKYVLFMLTRQQEPDIRAVDLLIQHYKKYADSGKAYGSHTVPSEGYFWKMITAYAQFFKTIPDHILKKFAQDAETLYVIGNHLYRMNMKIPVLIINALKNYAKTPSDHRNFTFFTDLNSNNAENVARIFELSNNAIDAREPKTSLKEQKETDRPEYKKNNKFVLAHTIASNTLTSVKFIIKKIEQNQEIPPELLQNINALKTGFIVYKRLLETFESGYLDHFPDALNVLVGSPVDAMNVFMDILKESGRASHLYRQWSNAKEKQLKRIKEFLLEKISQNSYTSENVALEMIKAVSPKEKNPQMPVPEKLFKKMSESTLSSFNFVKNVSQRWDAQLWIHQIPEYVIQSAKEWEQWARKNPDSVHIKMLDDPALRKAFEKI